MICSSLLTSPTDTLYHWRSSSPRAQDWAMVLCPMARDGHCLFHCLLAATYNNYIQASPNIRRQLVLHLRAALADRLETVVGTSRVYDQLHDGQLAAFALTVPEFSLAHMQATLRSSASIGHGYLTYICDQCHLDLYIINGETKRMYPTVELTVRGRLSVLVYYYQGHYDLLALVTSDGVQTALDSNHPLLGQLEEGRLV